MLSYLSLLFRTQRLQRLELPRDQRRGRHAAAEQNSVTRKCRNLGAGGQDAGEIERIGGGEGDEFAPRGPLARVAQTADRFGQCELFPRVALHEPAAAESGAAAEAGLAQRGREERAQARVAVGGDEAARGEVTQGLFHLGAQHAGVVHEVEEERRAVLLQRVRDLLRRRGEIALLDIGRAAAPMAHVLARQQRDGRHAHRRGLALLVAFVFRWLQTQPCEMARAAEAVEHLRVITFDARRQDVGLPGGGGYGVAFQLLQHRREIEPVSPADFMRILLRWQHLGEERGQGSEALAAVLEQLEGNSIPAAAWEAAILPARIESYYSQMLDGLCSAGRFTWLRLQAPKDRGDEKRKTTPVRMPPIALLPRQHVRHWRSGAADVEQSNLTATAQKVADTLQQLGAAFFIDLGHHTGMLRTQVEESLGDLAARGLVTADSYAGLRALITPALRKAGYGRHARRRRGASIDEAGRWELLRKTVTPERDSERIEDIARALLRRYGVVFRKLLERESKLPTWRELLYVYRRMEARGELRGGRFVQGYSGEQFALPEAVGSLRDTRKRPARGEFITLSAADPLNLAGVLTPGTKVPALAGNKVLFRDGVPVAAMIAGEFEPLQTLSTEEQRQMRERLLGKTVVSFQAKRPA